MAGPRDPETIVLKFGSSVLASEGDLPEAVHEVYRHVRLGTRVVAVVSALGKTTDGLVARAGAVSERPSPEALAAFLATGEKGAAALFALALDRGGVPATLIGPERIGLTAEGPSLDANPVGLHVSRLRAILATTPVVVLPGFFGIDGQGRPALLGRGGSDLTALFVAERLGATCRLLKRVDGVYERDPELPGPPPARYDTLGYDDALDLGARVVQEKALRFARAHRLTFEVAGLASGRATHVGPLPTALVPSQRPRPLRVGLLGLGTVGLGVYQHLRRRPDLFDVVGVAVRHPGKHADDGVPANRLHGDPWKVVETSCDVVVEAIGGYEPATSLLKAALSLGRDVVTANKAVVSSRGRGLAELAAEAGARFLCSAAVGGSIPALERVSASAGSLRSVEGVLNGTSNFVLDRLSAGVDLSDAVAEAQRLGFAEADPSEDLDGTDTARKAAILSLAAFGVLIDPEVIPRRGVDQRSVQAGPGQRAKLVASCRKVGERVEAVVRLATLLDDHPLAGCRGEENAILMVHRDGSRVVLEGKGAGRWPTAVSVLGDLLELWRGRRQGAPHETHGLPVRRRVGTAPGGLKNATAPVGMELT